jgi:ligand-binding sensor domain-containing protein
MKQYRIPIFATLLAALFFTSCNGQTITNQNNKEINSTKKIKQQLQIVRKNGTQSGVVGCEVLDKDGNLWFSINGEGAYRYDGKSFTNFTTKDGLCNNNISAIIQDRAGNILLGTNKGICKFNGKTFTTYPIPDTFSITCMLEDKNGYLWFGVMDKGVYRYDGTNLTNLLYKYDHPFFGDKSEKYISDILQDKKGNLWFSSWNGGGVWKYDGEEFINIVPTAAYYKANQDKRAFINTPQKALSNSSKESYTPSKNYITDDMIFSLTEDISGNIWFSTRDHGLCIYNGKTFTSIGIKEGFNSRGATKVLQDDKNNFWITTVDKGVWYYDGKTFKNFTENDGLVNNAVMNILKDKNGNIWFGTKYLGLSRYDGKKFTTFSYYNN